MLRTTAHVGGLGTEEGSTVGQPSGLLWILVLLLGQTKQDCASWMAGLVL